MIPPPPQLSDRRHKSVTHFIFVILTIVLLALYIAWLESLTKWNLSILNSVVISSFESMKPILDHIYWFKVVLTILVVTRTVTMIFMILRAIKPEHRVVGHMCIVILFVAIFAEFGAAVLFFKEHETCNEAPTPASVLSPTGSNWGAYNLCNDPRYCMFYGDFEEHLQVDTLLTFMIPSEPSCLSYAYTIWGPQSTLPVLQPSNLSPYYPFMMSLSTTLIYGIMNFFMIFISYLMGDGTIYYSYAGDYAEMADVGLYGYGSYGIASNMENSFPTPTTATAPYNGPNSLYSQTTRERFNSYETA